MAKKPKPQYAYASITPDGKINTYWVRPLARDTWGDCNPEGRKRLRKKGWRVAKVKIQIA